MCNIKQAEVSRHLMALCPRATINLVTKVASELSTCTTIRDNWWYCGSEELK